MSFTHALATNRYGEADLIVSSDPSQGTHTTLSAAMAAAVSGQTIFLRTSVSESVTITPGVNIAAWQGSSLNVPSITGTLTMTGAGTSTLTGLRLVTNSAPVITVSGSAASILYVKNCYLNCTNNTGISYSSSSSSSQIVFDNCRGNLGTTGIGIFTSTAAGILAFDWCAFGNSGASTTASTTSTGNIGIAWSSFSSPLSTSSTGVFVIAYSNINTSAQNVTSLTTAGTGTTQIEYSDLVAGTASALSIGSGTTVLVGGPSRFESSNTNVITGAGTLQYGQLNFTGSSSTINPTTQTGLVTSNGISRSSLQPAFLATHSVAQDNVTGAGAAATVNFTTEIFDQNSNYNGTNTFTAPYTGRYQFNGGIYVSGAATSTGGISTLVTSNRSYTGTTQTPFVLGSLDQYQMPFGVLADMDAADTATVTATVVGMAGNTADLAANVTNTYFSGFLAC